MTTHDIVAMLNAETIEALRSAGIRGKQQAIGAEPVGPTPREFTSLLLAQVQIMRETFEASGMRSN